LNFPTYTRAILALASTVILFTAALRRYVWLPSYFKVALATTLNIVLNTATLGHYVLLEGRVCSGVFKNWAGRFRYQPQKFAQPTTEQEIIGLVNGSKSLRVFGSGHSFNNGIVSEETLVSLDSYSGPVDKEGLKKAQIAVKGGTRVRKVVRLLFKKGLAFRALPSHDAQSIGGILSTDVHGTGKNWGFVSESVASIKLVDGRGEIHECRPSDDLFKAAIGGIGAVGIITEVVVEGVERFNIEQKVEMRDISFDKENDKKDFDELVHTCLENNDHFSLYLFPFAEKCQINTWKRTEKKQTAFGGFREFVSISKDALAAAWGGNLIAYTGLLPRGARWAYILKRGTDLVLESDRAFNRTIYHLHQELEFTVPYEDTFECCRQFIKLYEDLYKKMYPSGLPYTLIEVRFTSDKHERTLIGAGRGRQSTWIDLVCNDSQGFERFYVEAQKLMKEIGARPHLGKFCENLNKAGMENLHGDKFTRFLELVDEHDPKGKFANGFTRRLFGHGG
jgi:hypothetical protein